MAKRRKVDRGPLSDERALSIRPPFAQQILDGEKKIEYRPRRTSFRGRLWLHECGPKGRGIVGSVEITDIKEDFKPGGDGYDYGEYHWLLARPVALKAPVPCTGQLGLWRVPVGILEQCKP